MAYTQENRLIAIDTPLGKDALLLTGCHGIEGISGLFSFELNLLSENHNITFEDIIGKNVTVSIILADGDKRFFNGIISSFSQGRGGGEAGGDPHFSHYTATMVPWLWLLTRTADSRIFQKLSVPDIVEKIFTEKGFLDYKLLLNDSYDKRDYCVQYRETDFNFVSRLLEEEGICYLFEHDEEKHTLILADASDKFKPCPKQESARYQISAGGWLEEDVITSMEKMQEIRPAKYTINDFNFEISSTDMKVDVSTKQMLGPGEREIYDYPGLYTKKAQGERLTTIRMEEEETKITTITGSSDCRAFTSGYRFTLSNYYREDMDNKDYVLTHIEHEVREISDYYGASIESMGSESPYINRFKCIPFEVPYRPSRDTVKPVVRGTQTAIVVGPSGDEIYTDKYSRVKVQFHWDREGKRDENSSCWIRVSQVWAGQGWGAMHIPHVGHEVVVDFIEGDPDRPIITGRVYHGANMPADALPGEKTKSVIRSFGDNDIVIEDKDGDKCIHIKQACGNEIRMHESSPDIEIKQECGNEVLMKASGPDIEIKQACGNEVLMKASGPDIEIKQACGNEILMHEADGIQMRDKYGNEVVLDAASGFIHIGSPSHNSYLDVGKSLKWGSDSDGELFVGGERKITIAANTHESFMGTKTALSAAADISSVNGIVIKRYYAFEDQVNYCGYKKRTKGSVVVDSDESYHIKGGQDDVSQIKLDIVEVKISYNDSGSYVKINNNGIELKTLKKLVIDAEEVQIKTSGDIKMNPTGKVKIPPGHWDFGDGDG